MEFKGVIWTLASLCVWFAMLSAVFAPLERYFGLHQQKYLRKSFATDVVYYFLSSLTPKLLLTLPVSILTAVVHRYEPVAIYTWAASLPTPLRAFLALVVGEIGVYWGHRLSHEIPFLWRFHAVHHSAEEMDWLVNSKAHPVDLLITRFCGLVPMFVLGLAQPTADKLDYVPMLTMLIGTTWGFFIHANLSWRFGPLEWLVATPAFHHWHHTNDGPEFVNKNYATLLPAVDKVFGTLYLPPRQWPLKYGTDELKPAGLAVQLLHPVVPITHMIWIFSLLLVSAGILQAQDDMVSINTGPHIHFVPKGGCQGQPNKINMKSGNTYYACINGKSACSDDKYFPMEMAAAFDKHMKEFKQRVEKNLAEGQKRSEQIREQMAVSQREMEARIAAARASRPSMSTRASTSTGGVVEAAPPPPPSTKITAAKLSDIQEGTGRDELLFRLGPPYMKISGDAETFTYQMESGGVVRIQVEDGKVTKVKLAN